jgi:hypothetical protein
LDGAINEAYDLGTGITGHRNIEESAAAFDDFLPPAELRTARPGPGRGWAAPKPLGAAKPWSRLLAWWRRRFR